jgi:hypothetical protein
MFNKRKWLTRFNQKVMEMGRAVLHSALVVHTSPGREQAPNPMSSNRRNVETPYRSLRGRQAARSVFGGVGLGCWKKRMPDRNAPDTGCNITRHESEPTSDGSYVAREYVES